jgi:hypothetical protein
MISLVLVVLFILKHFLMDFVWQTQQEILNKGNYGNWIGIRHSVKHGLGTLFVLWIAQVNADYIVGLVVMDFFIHYHIDWAKTNLSRGLTIEDHRYWIWFGLDQTLHYLTYIAIIAIIVL